MNLLLALLLSQLDVSQNGTFKGRVQAVNCGANMSCVISNNKWQLSSTGGGGGITPNSCPGVQYANQIGATGLLSCNAVQFSQLGGTATDAQLASSYSGVGACAAHQFVTTETRNAAPTCAQAAFTDISGTATDGQLASAYSGVGTCGANTWVSAETRNAAPTCTSIPYSALTGCEPAQGSNPQLQYNNSACLAGMADVEASTTGDFNVLSLTNHPAAPAAPRTTHYDARPDSGWFAQNMMQDYATGGIPIPVGAMTASGYGVSGSGSRDIWRCVSLAVATQVGSGCTWTSTRQDWVPNNSSAATGSALADAGWFSHQPWCHLTSNTVGNSNAESHDTQAALFYSGGNGVGGFWWYTRMCSGKTMPANTGRVFVGLVNSNAQIGTTQEITKITNMAGFACDPADSNFKVCSNDTSATATCTGSLGSAFPCKQSGACIDFMLYSPPNDTRILYYALRLPDTDGTPHGDTASGALAAHFPDPNTTMAGHIHHNTGDAGVADDIFDGLEIECAHL